MTEVDKDAVAAFVSGLAARYDTVGTVRNFLTATGTEVALTGPYGWKIDVAGETAALISLLQAGPAAEPVEREPVYAATAASRTAPDWGTTYVEVDLTGQHVYMFKEGKLVWEAPCVTGNASKNYTTPAGIYCEEKSWRTAAMNMKALCPTGCLLTEASAFMTPAGGENSAESFIRKAEATAASIFLPHRFRLFTRWFIRGFRLSVMERKRINRPYVLCRAIRLKEAASNTGTSPLPV